MDKIEKNQIVFVIDHETLETHIYNGDGKNLRLEGHIDKAEDGNAIIINVRIELKD